MLKQLAGRRTFIETWCRPRDVQVNHRRGRVYRRLHLEDFGPQNEGGDDREHQQPPPQQRVAQGQWRPILHHSGTAGGIPDVGGGEQPDECGIDLSVCRRRALGNGRKARGLGCSPGRCIEPGSASQAEPCLRSGRGVGR